MSPSVPWVPRVMPAGTVLLHRAEVSWLTRPARREALVRPLTRSSGLTESEGHSERSCRAGCASRPRSRLATEPLTRGCDTGLGTHRVPVRALVRTAAGRERFAGTPVEAVIAD